MIRCEYQSVTCFIACALHYAENNPPLKRNDAISKLTVLMYQWLIGLYSNYSAHRGHRSCIGLSFCWAAVGWGIRDRAYRPPDGKAPRKPFNENLYLSHASDPYAMKLLGELGYKDYMKDQKRLTHLFVSLRQQGMCVGYCVHTDRQKEQYKDHVLEILARLHRYTSAGQDQAARDPEYVPTPLSLLASGEDRMILPAIEYQKLLEEERQADAEMAIVPNLESDSDTDDRMETGNVSTDTELAALGARASLSEEIAAEAVRAHLRPSPDTESVTGGGEPAVTRATTGNPTVDRAVHVALQTVSLRVRQLRQQRMMEELFPEEQAMDHEPSPSTARRDTEQNRQMSPEPDTEPEPSRRRKKSQTRSDSPSPSPQSRGRDRRHQRTRSKSRSKSRHRSKSHHRSMSRPCEPETEVQERLNIVRRAASKSRERHPFHLRLQPWALLKPRRAARPQRDYQALAPK